MCELSLYQVHAFIHHPPMNMYSPHHWTQRYQFKYNF